MNPFSLTPPNWVEGAVHAHGFCCPRCGADVSKSQAVWINRRSPVYTHAHRRKWQEFYQCGDCEAAWWVWSSDRPPTDWSGRKEESTDSQSDEDSFRF
ncbi:MAG: hypothetical protein AAF609_15940 [Cyanobacteria bacterium P01_C01_bin.120]